MAKEELEIDEEFDLDKTHFEETQQEESTTTHKGQVRFKSVNHSERAIKKFGRMSDGETAKYLNVALEYFDNRCALSGEKFVKFDKKTEGKSTNLSAEHVVALCIGGHDIVPNLTPSVLQYNIRKNGYYLLDWWDRQKDSNGKSIYSPYRLLKLVNYMMKSVRARGIDVKEYSKAILEPNTIDKYLDEIKAQDLEEADNSKRKFLSDTITATTIDEDNKKILTVVPTIEGSMPTQKAQAKELESKHYDERTMIDIFLIDAVKELAKVEEISNQEITLENGTKSTIQQELEQMLKETIGEIPFEVNIRDRILKVLDENNISNIYSVANDLLQNTDILKQAKTNELEVEKQIQERINSVNFENLTQEQKQKIIAINPQILYNEQEKEETNKLLQLYIQKYNENTEEINVELLSKVSFVNILKIKQWMEDNDTTKPPSMASKDEVEKKFGRDLNRIRNQYLKRYLELQTNEERQVYKEKHPELEEVMAIVEEIDRNNIPIYLANAREIKNWMEENATTTPPRTEANNKDEKKLGVALFSIRRHFIKPYNELQTDEDRKEYKAKYPELEEVMAIVEEIDRNNIPIYLANAREIKQWMEQNDTTKPPSEASKDEVEKKLGKKLGTIRNKYLKPYKELQTEEERQVYKEKHPELEEVMGIVEEIDRNNIPIYLANAREIKQWMEQNDITKPPSKTSKDEVEKNLGRKLDRIRNQYLKRYLEMKTKEERQVYKEKHPELEEVIAIVEEIDRNNIPIYLANAREIKQWMEQNDTTKPPSTTSKDEVEKNLGRKLDRIRNLYIKRYLEMKTNKERQVYKEKHPELEEVMAIVEEIDRNNEPIYLENAQEIKKWMEENYTTKPPARSSKDNIEKKLGRSLFTMRRLLIKPYLELNTDEERQKYKAKHPELEEVMAIVEEIDRNNIPIYLANAREIKQWMEYNETTKPPSEASKDEVENKLGINLSNIRRQYLKPYKELQTKEERQVYKEKHPELEEVMAIVEEIDRNNIPIYLANAREIKQWMEYNETTKPPSPTSKDEIEKKLGKKLVTIRSQYLKPYKELQTEEERQVYKEKHPELEEVMAIVEEIDRNNVRKRGVIVSLEEKKREKEKTLENAKILESKIDTEIAKVKQRKNDEVVR